VSGSTTYERLNKGNYVNKFTRRTFTSPGEFVKDFLDLLSRRASIRTAMRGDLVSPAFRERLMMIVTQVNACPYCRAFHSREALKSGVSDQELRVLLQGVVPDNSPQEELPALAYAQRWAECDGNPDPQDRASIERIYGPERAMAIDALLRMIRMGNLSGNTWDYLLYRLSFGSGDLRRGKKSH
jgi:AhpD family alkylhydroperoxidase